MTLKSPVIYLPVHDYTKVIFGHDCVSVDEVSSHDHVKWKILFPVSAALNTPFLLRRMLLFKMAGSWPRSSLCVNRPRCSRGPQNAQKKSEANIHAALLKVNLIMAVALT